MAAARQIRSRRILEMDDAAGTRVVATPRARLCMGAGARTPAGTHARTHVRMHGLVGSCGTGLPLNRCDAMRRRGTQGNERVEADRAARLLRGGKEDGV